MTNLLDFYYSPSARPFSVSVKSTLVTDPGNKMPVRIRLMEPQMLFKGKPYTVVVEHGEKPEQPQPADLVLVGTGTWDDVTMTRASPATIVVPEPHQPALVTSPLELEAWFQRAIIFDMGICPIHKRPIRIEARDQLDGRRLWVVKMHEWLLGKDAEWHWEPLPSERTDEFIQTTRFNSLEEAHAFWQSNVTEAKKLMVPT